MLLLESMLNNKIVLGDIFSFTNDKGGDYEYEIVEIDYSDKDTALIDVNHVGRSNIGTPRSNNVVVHDDWDVRIRLPEEKKEDLYDKMLEDELKDLNQEQRSQ